MKNRKLRLQVIITVAIIFAQVSMFPLVARATSRAQYEMKGWKMSVAGNTAGINFGYIGSDGAPLLGMFPIPKSLVEGHENDPSWTQYDSAAPVLAYIQKYGIDNNVKDSMNASCYDPSIFQALTAQGVNLSQLGGPNVPPGTTPPANLVGKANYGSNIGKVLVGVGVPAPDLSSLLGTSNKGNTSTVSMSTTASTPKVTAASPTPPAPASTPTTSPKTPTSTPKVGTNLNPVPQAQESSSASKTDPERTNPPIMALEDKTQTKIETPTTKNSDSAKTPWSTYAEIAGSGILAIGFMVFVKLKFLKA